MAGRREHDQGSSGGQDDRHAGWRSAAGLGFGGGRAAPPEPGAPSDLENAITRGRYGLPHWQEEPAVDDDRAVWGAAARQPASGGDALPGQPGTKAPGLLRRLATRLGFGRAARRSRAP